MEKLLHEELLELELNVELQLDEQQVRLLSDWQLQDELDEKEIFEEQWLDDEDGLNELLEVDELQLSLEYDPQDLDFDDEELDSLL